MSNYIFFCTAAFRAAGRIGATPISLHGYVMAYMSTPMFLAYVAQAPVWPPHMCTEEVHGSQGSAQGIKFEFLSWAHGPWAHGPCAHVVIVGLRMMDKPFDLLTC